MDKIAYFDVRLKIISTLSKDVIREMVKESLENCTHVPINENILTFSDWEEKCKICKELEEHVDSIICTVNGEVSEEFIKMSDYRRKKICVYSLNQETVATETMQYDSEELKVASHIILPNAEYEGLWETLYYDSNIKNNLLNFIESTILFSDKKVNPNIISWNKVILLHGPPGTGKTSLCKALAQKTAIRLGDRYSYVEFIEINSHSLFSKWFSESGKLVMKLFEEIRRLLEDPRALICVLIDEVESLAHARKSCTNGTEPSDAIRVVNALLTQLDEIKSYPNVLILTTSNVTEAIDLAFVDRADIKQYIGHPGIETIMNIYESCLQELIRTGLVTTSYDPKSMFKSMCCEVKDHVVRLQHKSLGLSGRCLRKLPFLTHAFFIQSEECDLIFFLRAMIRKVDEIKAAELAEKEKNDCNK